jgi:hypothetical protein
MGTPDHRRGCLLLALALIAAVVDLSTPLSYTLILTTHVVNLD